MADILTRAGKGSRLTHAELDTNLGNLNDELGLKAAADAVPEVGDDLLNITAPLYNTEIVVYDGAVGYQGSPRYLRQNVVAITPVSNVYTIDLALGDQIYILTPTANFEIVFSNAAPDAGCSIHIRPASTVAWNPINAAYKFVGHTPDTMPSDGTLEWFANVWCDERPNVWLGLSKQVPLV